MGISINVRDNATSAVKQIMSTAGVTWRTRVHRAMGRAVQELCKDHLMGVAASRHATADKLGAKPTEILARAAEQISLPAALSASAERAVISVNSPALSRVGHDVDIYPGTQTPGAKFLTIPANAAAYGNRYNKGLTEREGAKWIFVKHVHQKQDRTLLPSDQEIMQTATETLGDYVDQTIKGIKQEIDSRK